MNSSTPATPTQRRAHSGWLWVALTLHTIGAAAFQFGNDYSAIFESRIDGILRVIVLLGLALGLTQLSSLIVRQVAGAAIASSMRRRMIVAILVLGLLNLVLATNSIFRLPLFGLIVGIAWLKWTRLPPLWLLSAAAAGLLVHLLNQLEILRDLMPSLGILTSRAFYAASLGLIWALICGPFFAILRTFAPTKDMAEWRMTITALAKRYPDDRRSLQIFLALILVGAPWAVYIQGSQHCHWIDRALRRSGCVGSISATTRSLSGLAFSQDGGTLLVNDLDGASLYDFPTRKRIQSVTLPEETHIVAGAVAADGSQIALAMFTVGIFELKINIYRRDETTPFQTIVVTNDTYSPALGFALDGRSLLINDTIWNIADGTALGQVDAASRAQYRTASDQYNNYSADGSLNVHTNDGRVSIYKFV